MTTEAIFWYIIRTVSGIVSIFIAYMVLKYLNKKTLAMKTIFDEIIKDYIYLKLLDGLSNIVMDIVVNFLIPLDNYVALLIIISRRIIVMAGICQLIAIMLIRYLYVFKQTLLNNEILVRFVARFLVGCIALTTALLGDLENMDEYCLITGKKIEKDIFITSRSNIIPLSIGVIVLFITEYKIYKFKKCVDHQQKLDAIQVSGEEEEEERNGIHNYCKKNSNRIITLIVFGIVFTFFISIILYKVNVLSGKDLDLKRLRSIAIQNLVMQNIIPLILIVRNQKLFCFFEAQILTILRSCKLRKNQIEPMIELNVI